MRNFIMFFCSVFFVVLNVQAQSTTIEEQVLVQSFSVYQMGLAYDEICNKTDPKTRYDTKKKENVMLFGNQNLLTARIGGLMHKRNPDKTVDELVEDLINLSKVIEQAIKKKLNEQGCKGEAAQAAENAFKLYSTAQPIQINSFLDKRIVEGGGTITPPEGRDAIGESPK